MFTSFPWINRIAEEEFKPGMVMCLEPKIWLPGECYLRVEDMVLITDKGAESMTKFSREKFEL
jgi:Xaa-Pro dipeptidase